MALRTFDPGLAYDKATGRGIGSSLAVIYDAATGQTVQTYDLDGNPIPVITNSRGYFGQFQAEADIVRVEIAGVAFEVTNLEGSIGLVERAEAAEQAARDAAAAASAPAEEAIDTHLGGDATGLVPAVAGKVSKGELVVNIRDFGAIGDGVADDTAAVQAFFTHLKTNGGIGAGRGTFRITAPIATLGGKPFTFRGDGPGVTTFVADFANTGVGNVFNIGNTQGVSLGNFRIDGGGKATHGVALYSSPNMTVHNVEIIGWLGTAILSYQHPSYPTRPVDVRFVSCIADGGGVAANGILHESSSAPAIIDCHVRNLNPAASPSYALQFKNACDNGTILGGSVDGAAAGVAFGYDITGVSHSGNVVTGVTVRNCTHGFLGGWMDGNTVDLIVTMTSASQRAITLGGNTNRNSVRASVRGVHDAATVAYVQNNYNLIELPFIDKIGGATLVEFAAGSSRNTVVVGNIPDKSDLTRSQTKVLPNGTTDNSIVYLRSVGEIHAMTGGASLQRFTSDTDAGSYIQFVRPANQFVLRAAGTDALQVSGTYTAPGVDVTQTSGHSGRRWKEVWTRDGMIVNSPDGKKWRIGVDNAGILTITPIA